MSQAPISIANGSGAAVRAAVNSALQAITTKQSGGTAPSTTYPFMEWADTANDLLKQRNAANSAWIIKGTLSAEYGGIPASSISYDPGSPALLDATTVQEAIEQLKSDIDNKQTGVFTKFYESPEQTITSGGSLTLAHGMGTTPRLVVPSLICKTAEHGYSVNDEYMWPLGFGESSIATNALGIAVVTNSTNISIRYGAGTPPFIILNKGTGAYSGITTANWRLIIRAYG